MRRAIYRAGMCLIVLMATRAAVLQGQAPALVRAERSAFADWLAHAPVSPAAAVAQLPVSDSVRIGAASSDLPLDSAPPMVISRRGAELTLSADHATQPLPVGHAVRRGRYAFVAGGAPGRPVVMVFDSARTRDTTAWYPYNPALVFTGPLIPPAAPSRQRLLAPDGVEVEATDAGTVRLPLGDTLVELRVMRIPDPATNEASLEIYFRDATNGQTTYPAGRFVALVPAGAQRWRLDFNRARNPFCAYSPAYPCPAPWRGNLIAARMAVGEQYVPHPE